jgi:hypothetical protein
MHTKFSITLDESVANRTKELAGLVPFSRYVEKILAEEIRRLEISDQSAQIRGSGGGGP